MLHEELSDGLFDEINNVIEANTLLSGGKDAFFLGESIYYRIYAEMGEPPVAGIAGFYGVSRPTAARWVRRARQLGNLGPAKHGVAGEADETPQPARAGQKPTPARKRAR